MEQLSGLDASFLYMETERTPMHIGGVYLLRPSKAVADFGFETFRHHFEDRLGVTRIFRQRLVELPLHLGHPFWIEDPDFDLDYHLVRQTCPQPGERDDLMGLAESVFSQTLDRTKPLWQVHFVEEVHWQGYPSPCFAMITKVHHAAIDGGSGAEIMGALLDLAAKPKPRPPSPPWQPEPLPKVMDLLAKTYGKAIKKPLALTGFLGKTLSESAVALAGGAVKRISPPPAPFTAPKTPFNVIVGPDRVFAAAEFKLERIKTIKNALKGATVNDVVLTLCAGALRRYLLDMDALPKKPLVAMAPVSTRSQAQKGAMGNQVSAMLVSLATDESDPVKRLLGIHRSATGSKVYSKALSGTQLMEFLPSETAALAGRLYTSMKVGNKHRPFFNLIITNVPGPQVPLYLGGARMLNSIGTAPIFDGMGLIIVVTSYAGTLSISCTSCPEALSRPNSFVAHLEASMLELEHVLPNIGKLQVEDAPLSEINGAPASTGKETLAQTCTRLDAALARLESKVGHKTFPSKSPSSEVSSSRGTKDENL